MGLLLMINTVSVNLLLIFPLSFMSKIVKNACHNCGFLTYTTKKSSKSSHLGSGNHQTLPRMSDCRPFWFFS